ncbi:MAG: hypothetical protein RSC85_01480 [Bacilli bacterium]
MINEEKRLETKGLNNMAFMIIGLIALWQIILLTPLLLFGILNTPLLLTIYLTSMGLTSTWTILEVHKEMKKIAKEKKFEVLDNCYDSLNEYINEDDSAFICIDEKTKALIKKNTPPINSNNLDKISLRDLKIIKSNLEDYQNITRINSEKPKVYENIKKF